MTDTTLMTADTTDQATSDGAEAATTEVVEGQAQEQTTTSTEGEAKTETTDEAKPEGEKQEKAEGDADKPQGAPEEYADFTAPEGVQLDDEVLGEFKTLGKELNLSQDQAQKVADLGVKLSQKWASDQAESVQALRKDWLDTTKGDKEIGGDNLPQTLSAAKRALDAFGSPALIELFNQTGLGDHPELVRFAAKAGQAISEDKLVSAEGEAKPAPKSHAQRIFPNSN